MFMSRNQHNNFSKNIFASWKLLTPIIINVITKISAENIKMIKRTNLRKTNTTHDTLKGSEMKINDRKSNEKINSLISANLLFVESES